MQLQYAEHEKIRLKTHPHFNEAWLHDRICDNPAILGLGDVRVLDRERPLSGGGRLDLLLFDDDNNRRYEVEIMLGATDPSHIIRTIEYWDIERRRYPGYDHVAVLVAEDITARFLNVVSLLSGSIPLVAIQLNALRIGEHITINFIPVLDQTELRVDDETEGSNDGQTDRAYWNDKAGPALMRICDEILSMINAYSRSQREFHYRKWILGLRSNGVVNNFIKFAPKPTKKFVHVWIRSPNSSAWKDRFEEASIPSRSQRSGQFRITVTADEFDEHRSLIQEAIAEAVQEQEA